MNKALIMNKLLKYGECVGKGWKIGINDDGFFEVYIGECFFQEFEFAIDALKSVSHLL